MYDILELNKKLLPELKEIAKQLDVKKADVLRKQDLIYKILDQQAVMATESKRPESRPENSQMQNHKRRGRRPRVPENERAEAINEAKINMDQDVFPEQVGVKQDIPSEPPVTDVTPVAPPPDKSKGGFFTRAFDGKRSPNDFRKRK